MSDNTVNTNATATEANGKDDVVKVDLSTIPPLPVARNDVTIALKPQLFSKKGDRKGQIFYSIPDEYFTPERLPEVINFFGPKMFFKRVANSARQLAQGLDNVATDKGKDPLDPEVLQQYWQEMSTRGEPIGEMKEEYSLHNVLLQRLTDNPINEQNVIAVFTAINEEATKKHAEAEDAEDTDPVLLSSELLEKMVNSIRVNTESFQKLSNNPAIKSLDQTSRETILGNAEGKIGGEVLNIAADSMKSLANKIQENTRVRRKKADRVTSTTTETAEATA